MIRFRFIIIGFLITFASAWLGLAIVPSIHYSRQAARVAAQPLTPVLDAIRRGEIVYGNNGCVYCHSQQVRSVHFGSDVARLWGRRRTVADDYLLDRKAMMGTMRTGPDLSNIGERMASTSWHYQHLFDPESTSPGSNMPPYPHLFDYIPAPGGVADPDAVVYSVGGGQVDGHGMQWVPNQDGRDLVVYLMSLKRSVQERPQADEAPPPDVRAQTP